MKGMERSGIKLVVTQQGMKELKMLEAWKAIADLKNLVFEYPPPLTLNPTLNRNIFRLFYSIKGEGTEVNKCFQAYKG
jgi:hypothetical protein